MEFHKIAYIKTEFPGKFGIPRQSGLADTKGTVIFEKKYRSADALRGIEGYSHLWILWEFSETIRDTWSPTVRPPRLGGNERVGVFATRSPFRPNPIGLSCVKLESAEMDDRYGPVLYVTGVDMVDGTPIYDIKPYLPYVDSHPEAEGGFAEGLKGRKLETVFSQECEEYLCKEEEKVLAQILSQDPRPSYQNDPARIYGMEYAGWDVKFRVEGDQVFVCGLEKTQ